MTAGVYILRSLSNKIYVGSSVKLERRKKYHLDALYHGRHPNHHLQSAWNKYGGLEFTVILICSPDMAIFYEQRALDVIKPEMNKAPTAGSMRGYKHSEETKQKIGLFGVGRVKSATEIARLRAANIGKKVSAETRQKLSKAMLGKCQSAATIAKRAETLRGHDVSAATREKIRKALRGRTKNLNEVQRAKLRDLVRMNFHSPVAKQRSLASRQTPPYRDGARTRQLGHKDSPETRAKKAVMATGRPVSKETRMKLAAQAGWKHTEEAKSNMRAAYAAMAPDARSTRGRHNAMSGTAEERSERSRKAAMTGSPEERSARARLAGLASRAARQVRRSIPEDTRLTPADFEISSK